MKPVKESLISEGRLVGQLMHKHRGKARGATVKQLAQALTGEACTPSVERHIRHLVVELRKNGIPVCACPSQGYFIAVDEDEVEETCRNLYDRAMTSLQQVAGLRRMAMPQLMGQLGLDAKTGANQ